MVDTLMRAGSELQTMLLAQALAEAGESVSIGVLARWERELDPRVASLAEQGVTVDLLTNSRGPLGWGAALYRLRLRLKRNPPDIVYAVMSRSGLLASVASVGLSVPVVQARRELVSARRGGRIRALVRNCSLRCSAGLIANCKAVLRQVESSEPVDRLPRTVIFNSIPPEFFDAVPPEDIV
ncbi:MAG: glycosyltransferase, partial [Planctomycetales bacterium]|nr:glycosyltransferase [Planctomycetales bacterium]